MGLPKYVSCPNCRQRKLGPYETDTSSIHRSSGTCPHCGKRYKVEYGKRKIKASKA